MVDRINRTMSGLISPSPRLFTIESANRTLPLVSAIADELIPLWQTVTSTRRRIHHLADSRESERGNPYSDELDAMRERIQLQSKKIESLIEELREFGAEFKTSDQRAHVCFPTILDGRIAYLSWCPGESEVNHWLELDATFPERQKLLQPVETTSAGSLS